MKTLWGCVCVNFLTFLSRLRYLTLQSIISSLNTSKRGLVAVFRIKNPLLRFDIIGVLYRLATEFSPVFLSVNAKLWKVFFVYFRDMHHHVCGSDFYGLCDKMKPIDGEVLLRFLRQVNFTGQPNQSSILLLMTKLNFTGQRKTNLLVSSLRNDLFLMIQVKFYRRKFLFSFSA